MEDNSPKRKIQEVEGGWEEERKLGRRYDAGASLRPPASPSSNSLSPGPLLSPFSPSTPYNNLENGWTDLSENPAIYDDETLRTGTASPISSRLEDVCFGMLCGVKARLRDVAQILEGTFGVKNDSSQEEWERLAMVERDNHIALQRLPGPDLAVLNNGIVHAIHLLSNMSTFQYDILVGRKELFGATAAWAAKGKSVDFHVDIIICGQRGYSEELGSILSGSSLYLQVPRYCPGYVPYQNPHVWDLGHPTELALRPPSSGDNPGPTINEPGLASSPNAKDGNAQLRSLYGLVTAGIAQSYEHKITGTRSLHEPNDKIGGIIADQMGLGKTLTILSAVAGSSKIAALWAGPSNNRSFGAHLVPRVRATLVVVPSEAIIGQWMGEIKSHFVEHPMQILKYHGQNRAQSSEEFAACDIVLSTYATVTAEFRAGASRVHSIQWFRVVLDEAHNIRDQRTVQFRVMRALSAKLRWCLTGTPIQNSLDDLCGLVRFLRVPLLDTKSSYRQNIVSPVEKGLSIGHTNLRILLQSICVRRLSRLLNLPDPTRTTRPISLTDHERAEYHQIILDTNIAVETDISEGRRADARQKMFKMVLKLRLLCAYGTFYRLWENSQNIDSFEEQFAVLQQLNEARCASCSCDITSIDHSGGSNSSQLTRCLHLLCNDCITQDGTLDSSREASTDDRLEHKPCSICAKAVQYDQKRGKGWQTDEIGTDVTDMGYSAKLSSLVSDIGEQCHADKIIVFSFWKRALCILASLLERRNLPALLIDGSISTKRREDIIRTFENPGNNILLMTLGTGAVGLNLTMANRVHIIEPQWNPTVEEQAIGRVLRLGQQKKVYVTRYIVTNSIEEYVRDKQFKKLKLAEVGWGGSTEEMQKAKELWSELDNDQ
ncbi:SNF2 family N-terminal domain-containing protein [Aspergillus karnatakaensis]|uniref:DEAD/DEAH box helicase n=1 Tax=Aspergillus karnatakaensis TaxID=1810916 RepID=UPI003CCD08F8